MKPKRNVADVDYIAADLSVTPMRQVLADRKRRSTTIAAAVRYEAFKQRAGAIGVLQSCLCAYPIESNHREWCPALALLESQRVAERRET